MRRVLVTLTASDGRPVRYRSGDERLGSRTGLQDMDQRRKKKHIRQLADFIKRGTSGKGVSGNFRRARRSSTTEGLKL